MAIEIAISAAVSGIKDQGRNLGGVSDSVINENTTAFPLANGESIGLNDREMDILGKLLTDKNFASDPDLINNPALKSLMSKLKKGQFKSEENKVKKVDVQSEKNNGKSNKQASIQQKFSIDYSKSNILRNKHAEALVEKLNSVNGPLPPKKLKMNSFEKKPPLIEKFSKNPAPLFDGNYKK